MVESGMGRPNNRKDPAMKWPKEKHEKWIYEKEKRTEVRNRSEQIENGSKER